MADAGTYISRHSGEEIDNAVDKMGGVVQVADGGTGATTEAGARGNLGANFQTFYSLPQIGLTDATVTIETLFAALPRNSIYEGYFSDSNQPNFSHPLTAQGYKLRAVRDANSGTFYLSATTSASNTRPVIVFEAGYRDYNDNDRGFSGWAQVFPVAGLPFQVDSFADVPGTDVNDWGVGLYGPNNAIASTLQNWPFPSKAGRLECTLSFSDANYLRQEAVQYYTNTKMERFRYVGGEWSEWVQTYPPTIASPNGTTYQLQVSDSGVISAVAT